MNRVNFWFKTPQMKLMNTIEKNQTRATEENSDFKHIDFSGGFLGI